MPHCGSMIYLVTTSACMMVASDSILTTSTHKKGQEYETTPHSSAPLWGHAVQSWFAETRFAETPTLTLTLNPNFGESGFGKSGRHQPLTLISANRVSANQVSANWEDTGHAISWQAREDWARHHCIRCFNMCLSPSAWFVGLRPDQTVQDIVCPVFVEWNCSF